MSFKISNAVAESITVDALTIEAGKYVEVSSVSANANEALVKGLVTISLIPDPTQPNTSYVNNPYGSDLVLPGVVVDEALGGSAPGAGTVTSVAATAVAPLVVSGSPITGAGTLAFSLANTPAAAQFLAGPTGAAGAPTYRAIQASDIGTVVNSLIVAAAATVAPLMDGVAAVGVSQLYARQDHVHPSDTSRAPLASPTFTGTPAAPTAATATSTTQIATTAFVHAAITAAAPVAATTSVAGLVKQAADVANLTDSTTGAASTTLTAASATYTPSDLNNNVSSLNAQINRITAALVTAGIMV